MSIFHLAISPQGRLWIEQAPAADARGTEDGRPPNSEPVLDQLRADFATSTAAGLFSLAVTTLPDTVPETKPGKVSGDMPAEVAFWKRWAVDLLHSLCHLDESGRQQFMASAKVTLESVVPPPDDLALAVLVSEAPPMRGLEFLTPQLLRKFWVDLAGVVRQKASEDRSGLVGLLQRINPQWQLVGRVTFHLAENKKDAARPFAFLATYSNKLSHKGSVKHQPLADALREYAGQGDQEKLAELLKPVRMASEHSPLIRKWLESRALFQPQALTIDDAYQFLRDVPQMEEAGLVVRVPNWWRTRQSSRPSVQVRLGDRQPPQMDSSALLDFSISLALDGQSLSATEQKELLAAQDGLLLLRGKWVEVDRQRLGEALNHWKHLQQEHADGIDFLRGMRLLAGASIAEHSGEESTASEWAHVTSGKWLTEIMTTMRDPTGRIDCEPGAGLQAQLRPYQAAGVRWLWFMTRLKLGACLADDMGLGKTIQVIDLFLRRKAARTRGTHSKKSGPVSQRDSVATPHLLVVPASLMGNWKAELARFAPQLTAIFAHRSEIDNKTLSKIAAHPQQSLQGVDVVVTSYTMVRTAQWMSSLDWDLVILDEAQAIKNTTSAQTRAVKKLRASCRVVLTGTPVENQLGDLWSLFDFCSPGLLGTAKEFKDYVKRLGQQPEGKAYGSLRRLVQPYILRRMKTDPSIVPDLPEKTEMRVECGLSKRQAVLYQKVVQELSDELKKLVQQDKGNSIRRRGIVLSTMMRLKQICNHPSQLTDAAEFLPQDSGKFLQLTEICESLRERQEKALVFTQFQSICQPLADHLARVFGQNGVVLHGGTPVGKRKELVKRFQDEESLPFFVISLKAGGTGLNLTAASHVIHFDRWWNPAVENQATDRAFRIGQKRNVLVHKFVCRGTLEERIDEMIRSKQELADQILGQSHEGERMLTEMSDRDLLNFVALDVRSCEV
jgi:hypothetical protein